ncbi:MAG: VOC family protein [Phycisphaerae bacterium]
MSATASHVPAGYHTVTPSLIVKDPDAALAFYRKAFGAEEVVCMRSSSGAVMHAEFKIGDSPVMLGGEWPDHGMKAPLAGHNSGGLHIYVRDVDRAFEQAVAAGGAVVMPPSNMFWGDRYAKIKDPFGHIWGLATRVEEVPPDEMARRAAAWKP